MRYEAKKVKDVLGIERYQIEGTYSTILKENDEVCLKISTIKRYKNEKPVSWGTVATIIGFKTIDEALEFYSDRVLANDKRVKE